MIIAEPGDEKPSRVIAICPALTIDGVARYSYTIDRRADLANANEWVGLTNLTLTQPVSL